MAENSQNTEYLCDFAYIDRGRAALYFAQLSEDGTLVQLKRTSKEGASDNHKGMVGLPKILAGETSAGTNYETGLEGHYDPAWLLPIQVMHKLDELEYVSTSLEDARIGQMVLFKATMQIIDVRMLKELWPNVGDVLAAEAAAAIPPGTPPKLKQAQLAQAQQTNRKMAELIGKMPHSLQALFRSGPHRIWTTLQGADMVINPDDFAFKHGGNIAGEWHVLGIVDALPDGATPALTGGHGATGLVDAMIGLLNSLRGLMGRSKDAYGITPISIFRTIKRA